MHEKDGEGLHGVVIETELQHTGWAVALLKMSPLLKKSPSSRTAVAEVRNRRPARGRGDS